MIARIWHGWTAPGHADEYEALVKRQVSLAVQSRRIPGFKSIQVLRRQLDQEVEFATIMYFDTMDAVREFGGKDYEVAVVTDDARALLSRFDARSQHYEIRAEAVGPG